MKKMTKRIALALSMVLFALAFTACGPNLLSGGDGGSKDTEGGIGDTLSNMFFDYTVLEATSPAEYDGYTAAEGKPSDRLQRKGEEHLWRNDPHV